MDTIASRLQWARKRAGYGKPTECAQNFGWTVSTYISHENGTRNPSREMAKEYARRFGVEWDWLLEGSKPVDNVVLDVRLPKHLMPERAGAEEQDAPALRAEVTCLREIIRRLDEQVRDLRNERDAWRAQATANIES